MKICTKCGARMSDSNRFCEKCGSPLVTETAAGHTAVPVRSETSLSQLVGWLQKYGRHIMRVAALLAVVLFFCPLFLVSCEGVQMNVSGFQTATGFGFDDDGNTKSSWFLSEEDNSRYYTQDNASLPQGSLTAFAALLLAGGMLGSTFVLAQNASRTEQKNVHGVQIALAAAHVAALFYIFERLKKAARIEGMAWANFTTVEPTGWFKLDVALTILYLIVAAVCLAGAAADTGSAVPHAPAAPAPAPVPPRSTVPSSAPRPDVPVRPSAPAEPPVPDDGEATLYVFPTHPAGEKNAAAPLPDPEPAPFWPMDDRTERVTPSAGSYGCAAPVAPAYGYAEPSAPTAADYGYAEPAAPAAASYGYAEPSAPAAANYGCAEPSAPAATGYGYAEPAAPAAPAASAAAAPETSVRISGAAGAARNEKKNTHFHQAPSL